MENKIIMQSEEVSRIVFHFNKGHLTDPSIPMWTIKHKGQTYYVNHVDSQIGFSTKETPENPTTKGSIQFKGRIKIYEENGQTIAQIY